MRAVVVAIAIVMTGACDRSTAPAEAPCHRPRAVADSATDTPATTTPSFTDRVWLRADAGSAPGAMQVYLSDGTLISDSCFETYRLSSWRLEGEELVWSEDGVDIRARARERRFQRADAPSHAARRRGGTAIHRRNGPLRLPRHAALTSVCMRLLLTQRRRRRASLSGVRCGIACPVGLARTQALALHRLHACVVVGVATVLAFVLALPSPYLALGFLARDAVRFLDPADEYVAIALDDVELSSVSLPHCFLTWPFA